MRSGRYLTINLPAQLETIFMAFIFCKISELKYKLIFKNPLIRSQTCKYWDIDNNDVLGSRAAPGFRNWPQPLKFKIRNIETSLVFPSISFLPYKLVFIAHKLFYASIPPSLPRLSQQIIDNKIPPEQKLHPNLAAPAVFRGMIFCFFFLKIQFPVKSVLVLLSPGLVSLLCLLSPSPSWQW